MRYLRFVTDRRAYTRPASSFVLNVTSSNGTDRVVCCPRLQIVVCCCQLCVLQMLCSSGRFREGQWHSRCSHVHRSSPLLGRGWLSAAGEFGAASEAETNLKFDRFWVDRGQEPLRDNLAEGNRCWGHSHAPAQVLPLIIEDQVSSRFWRSANLHAALKANAGWLSDALRSAPDAMPFVQLADSCI